MRCCRATRLESMREKRLRYGQRAGRVVRPALELDEKENGLHKFHFLVVREGYDHLFVLLGDREVLRRDRDDGVLDVLLLLERIADLGDGRPLGGDLVDRPLDREELVERWQDPHADERQEADDDGPEQQPEQGDAALAL